MILNSKVAAALSLIISGIFNIPAVATSQDHTAPTYFSINAATPTEELKALDLNIGGRVVRHDTGNGQFEYERQWPGTYIEAAFRGDNAYFDVGTGQVILAVSVDGSPPVNLIRPNPGRYQISGMTDGEHFIRIQVINENQDTPTRLGSIYIERHATALAPPNRSRQIEFIGDSHTVGYANTSDRRVCTNDEIWTTTNTSLGIAGQLSTLYAADYQVNAISGRGVVRNYGGGINPTLPQQYPYTLLSESTPYTPIDWSPTLVVVSLGTNDFSTDLKQGESWKSRQDLISDYQRKFGIFLRNIQHRYPEAFIIVWVAAAPNAEQSMAAASTIERLKARGEDRIEFMPIDGLSFTACNWHPSVADAKIVADKIDTFIRRNNILPE